ncbi:hypothetical protein V6Z11_A01G071400 [Gossypium hirsutum]
MEKRERERGRGEVISGHKAGHRPVAGPPSPATAGHLPRWPEKNISIVILLHHIPTELILYLSSGPR